MNKDNEQNIDKKHFAKPIISSHKSFSPVWILPIVALLIGIGLIIESFLSSGIMITLQVHSAEGIEVGKTRVLYKGIAAGVVKNRTVTEDLQNVILHIEMDKKTAPFLNQNSKFWIVEPRISLSGISGLDTLIGGRYIAIDTDEKGEEQREFIALDVPPPPSSDTPGLHIKLRLNHLASINRGTIIYYKQIPVGEVTNYTLAEKDSEIHAWVLIKPEYAHLVKDNSLFYNVSGIKINAGLSGVKVETESLISILAGGIAFYNPIDIEQGKPAKHGTFYLLYSDFEHAKVGIPIVLHFKSTESIQENNTQIMFQGKKIGSLGSFTYDKENNEVIVLASIDPIMKDVLTENTQFWIVKPSINLLNVSGLDALLKGNYIQIRPAVTGKEKRDFMVHESRPALSHKSPGLHFYIEADALNSISKGAPIHYKNIPVGLIEDFKLSKDGKHVIFKTFIKKEFAHLVKNNSRFYNVSGLNIKGDVSGIKVEIESLASLLKGGISFYTPEHENTQAVSKNGVKFELYDSFDDAKAGIKISLIFDTAVGLSEGNTKIIYKGIVLGVVQKITPNKNQETVTVTAVLDPITEMALVADTRFWMVKPKISLTEIENLDTLISGEYITLRIGSSKKKQSTFTVDQHQPPFSYSRPGLHLKIKSTELGAISVGSPVMYNRIKIGDVQDYELAKNRHDINILVHIWPQYSNLVNAKSRFYNASGFKVNVSLARFELQSGSIESILNGGISLYNEVQRSSKKQPALKNGHVFKLFKDIDAAHMNAFYVRVQFNRPKGLVFGSKVEFRGVNVGSVKTIRLNKKSPDSVWVTLELDSSLKTILGKNSRFWIKTAKIGLTRTENLATLVTGSIISIKPLKGPASDFFIGLEEPPLQAEAMDGFTVNLTASRLSSVKVGDPVYYRQVVVGSVIGFELADTADQILIYLNIRQRFKPLIRENSKFWHASGFAMDINLFGTSKIRSESMEAILAGGIAFATPDNEQMGKQLSSGSFFVLHDEPLSAWQQWNPIIQLEQETQQN